MTSSRSTKRALLTSALAILMCVAMLIGSTFAWFTDTASTAVNKIQAGNLDIEVQYRTTADGEWKTLDNATDLFGAEGTLFEPGHTRVVELRITNAGNLALKYKIGMNVVSETAGINKAGNSYKLSEYLKVATTGIQQYNPTDQISSLMERLIFQKGDFGMWTARDFANFELEYTSDGRAHSLQPGAAQILGIKVYMPTTVGNEANAISPEKAASISFGLSVMATQYTVESDSFDSRYDKNAQYDDVDYSHATDDGSLKDALEGTLVSEKPSYVDLNEGAFSLGSEDTIGANTTLAGSGIGKTTLNAEKMSVSKDDIVIKDMTIKGKAPAGNDGALKIGGKNTTIENVKFVGQGFNGDTKGISVTGENLTIRNSNISNAFRGIIFWDNIGGNNFIENCTIDNVIYTFNINAANVKPDTTLTVKNSTLNGWTSYAGCMQKVTFENCDLGKSNGYAYLVAYADSAFTGCTFHDGYQVAAGSTGKTLTFTNCKLADGTVITAENFAEKLGDVDATLKGCTVIVDGTTVNWN